MRVLVVANTACQGFVGERLMEIGFPPRNIIMIDDGRQVLRCLSEFPSIGLVITGFRMLGASGLVVSREVKELVNPPRVILVVPWRERGVARPVAAEVKADALLYHPFEAMALRGVIEEVSNRPNHRILLARGGRVVS